MRDALNLNLMPIAEDSVGAVGVKMCGGNAILKMSNGYYGYQPVPHAKENACEQMEIQGYDTQAPLSGTIKGERERRKRSWEYASWDCPDFKKRRQSGKCTPAMVTVLCS